MHQQFRHFRSNSSFIPCRFHLAYAFALSRNYIWTAIPLAVGHVQQSPKLAVGRRDASLLRLRLPPLQSNQVFLPVHLIPAQVQDLSLSHAEVVTNHQNQPLVLWQFVPKIHVLIMFEETFSYVVLHEQLDFRRRAD